MAKKPANKIEGKESSLSPVDEVKEPIEEKVAKEPESLKLNSKLEEKMAIGSAK